MEAYVWRKIENGKNDTDFSAEYWVTNIFIRIMKPPPFITRWLIRQTHGERF